MTKDATRSVDGHDKPTILIVDDSDVFRGQLARALKRRGYEVREAAGPSAAIASAKNDSPEMAVVDLRIPDGSGLDVLRELVEIDPTTKVVMLTGYGSIATTVDAMRLGAVNYLQKPADADDVLAAFARAEQPPEAGSPVEYTAPSLARAEWEHIQRVLTDCGGNISETARRLGIHRRTLQRKLQIIPPRE